MYRPNYFYGGYAVHGMTSVPAYPASHGCVRMMVSERPHGSGEQAQGVLDRTSHDPDVLRGMRARVGPKGLQPSGRMP